jgi:hypothetical protein
MMATAAAATTATSSEAHVPIADVGDQLLAILPKIALVLAVLIAGIIISALLRRATRWLVRKTGLEALGERVGASKALYAIGAKGSVAHLLGTVVWIAGLLLTFSVIAEMLALPGLAEGVAAVTGFLPRLIAAGFVLVAGMFLADMVRTLVIRTGERRDGARLESPALVGQVLYYTVLTVAVAMAVGQVGLETDLINVLIAVVAGALFLSLGLAFALGVRGVVKNVTARHYLQGVCAPGDRLTIAGERGVVLRFTATSVVLEAPDGAHVVVPCALALEAAVRVRRAGGRGPEDPDDAANNVNPEM